MKNMKLIFICSLIFLLFGCNAGGSFLNGSSMLVQGDNVSTEYAYVLGQKSIFSGQVTNGGNLANLKQVYLGSGLKALDMVLNNSGGYLYVTASTQQNINLLLTFKVLENHNLSQYPINTKVLNFGQGVKIKIGPDGKYVYIVNNYKNRQNLNSGSISIFKILANGNLKQTSTSPINFGQGVYPTDIDFMKGLNNNFAYVITSDSKLSAYVIGNGSFNFIGSAVTAQSPNVLAIHSLSMKGLNPGSSIYGDSTFAIVSDGGSTSSPVSNPTFVVHNLNIANGSIDNIPEVFRPFSTPRSITFGNSGAYVYITGTFKPNSGGFTSTYQINASTGELYCIQNTIIPQAITPSTATLDKTGHYLFVGNNGNTNDKSLLVAKINGNSGIISKFTKINIPEAQTKLLFQ